MSHIYGFVPRITSRNRRGVARALRPPTLDEPDGLHVSWLVLDAPSALADPTLPADLRAAGASIIVDTGAWRFADLRTFDTPKWANLPYTPERPFEPTRKWVDEYVARDLAIQLELGASVYLVPGWFPPPRLPEDEVARRADLSFQAADRVVGKDVDLRPLIAYVAVRGGDLERAHSHLAQLNAGYTGVYLQISPVTPYTDPADRLSRQVALLSAARAYGRQVIAGHHGALSISLKALGIDAADAGLGEAESFNLSSKIRNQQSRSPDEKGGHPSGPRIYVPEIGRSIDGRLWRHLMSVPAIRAELLCKRACCRFRTVESLPQRATEHALQSRIEESAEIERLPASMRIDHADRHLARIETRLGVINSALDAENQAPLSLAFVNAQRSLLSEHHPHSGAA
jgi:hypothetical protein